MKLEKQAYRSIYEKEDEHWWFLGRRRVLGALLDALDPPGDWRVLDVGCGTGGNFPFLSRYGEVEGCDYSEEAVRFCRLRGDVPVREASIYELPYADCSFDLVTCLDVIEHLRLDLPAFLELRRVARKGGRVLVTLPAGPGIYSDFDCLAGHLRRYTLPEVRLLMRESGLEIERLTGYTVLVHPLIRYYRRRGSISSGDGRYTQAMETIHRPTNHILVRALELEARLISRWDLRGGSSLAALARRP
ncbi:MAG: methyltransferase domain-containing protein [Actinobacteria bacterium]|nr:methyltransferase domain-containing protein [Actinomycetota bacterium]MDI6831759.1 methyltransferase domain-containing protein [Actinomycetota bacterium]